MSDDDYDDLIREAEELHEHEQQIEPDDNFTNDPLFTRIDDPVEAVEQRSRIGCEVCANVTILKDYQDRLKVLVCYRCSRLSDDFNLISRSKAKSDFLVSDADLDTLNFIERKNPRHESWGMMKLYLTRQVQEISKKKFASKDLLEKEKEKRQVEALNRQLQLIQKKRAREKKEEQEDMKVAKLAKILQEKKEDASKKHEHVFDEEEKTLVNESEALWKNKCKLCAFEIEFQDF